MNVKPLKHNIKNKDFFYLQYNQINWKNQEKTKINSLVNKYIIKKIISTHQGDSVNVFDIGFGIGFFIQTLLNALRRRYKKIIVEGCEPSSVNFQHSLLNKEKLSRNMKLRLFKNTFQNTETKTKFDFITAIYVFPHFLSDDLEQVAKKIYSMLKNSGKFILVVANEKYLAQKLKTEKDLFIETENVFYGGRRYKEILHYSDIPKIGKVIDYNREEKYYIDLFKNNKFTLEHKKDLNDSGFICTVLVFKK